MKNIFYYLLLVGACGKPQVGSELDYISWGEAGARRSTISASQKDELKVCLNGNMSQEDFERVKKWSIKSVLTWLRVAKSVDDSVVGKITFTCSRYDLLIRLRPGSGTSFASAGETTIYLARPYGTWTHELGHALAALGDTYQGRTAGSCRSGHDPSLMCWGAYGPRRDHEEFSTLWEDDINGFLHNYRLVFGDEIEAPEWGGELDLLASFDPVEPWPGYDPQAVEFKDSRVFVDPKKLPTEVDNRESDKIIDL